MLYTIKRRDEITKDLAQPYVSEISRAGPVIGVLRILCYLHKEPSPPSLSPVGAHLLSIGFGVWQNVEKYIEENFGAELYRIG